jgi:hypothetical protein
MLIQFREVIDFILNDTKHINTPFDRFAVFITLEDTIRELPAGLTTLKFG